MSNIDGLSSHKISTDNSSSVLLGAGITFTGAWEDVSDFTTAAVSIYGNLAAEPGTLYFDVSHDGITVAGTIEVDIPNNVFFDKPHILNLIENYIRIRYTNGATPQTAFGLQTKYSNGQQLGLLHSIDETIYDTSEGVIVKAVNIAKGPNGAFVNDRQGGYNTSLESSTPLAIGATWTSPIVDLEGYSQLWTEVSSDVDGTITGEWYDDLAGTNLIRTFTAPYVAADGLFFSATILLGRFLKYSFTNGSVIQTRFHFKTHLDNKAYSGQFLKLSSFVPPNILAQVNRSLIMGQDSVGTYRNINANSLGQLSVDISNPITAFGDLRTAELTPLVQLTFPYNINTDILNISEVNSGTVTQADSKAVVQTSTNVAGEAMFDSVKPVKYRSGFGMLARFAGHFTTGVADSEQGMGLMDDEDGVAFGFDGATFGIIHRQNSVDVWIPQTTWNVDRMDGSANALNPSQMTLDHTKLNVFAIPFQFLGAGQISCYIEDKTTGKFTLVHAIQ
ncbi:hypothetical protein N9893_01580, partial [bacterium]|nr:hypothetical protein [bacterium]